MATPAKKTDDATPAPPHTVTPIPSGNVKRNSDSDFHIQKWFVRLPAGIVLQDLQDAPSELWKNVLGNPHSAIRKFDEMTIVDFDESWIVHATVGAVDHERVTLCGFKKTDLPAKPGNLFEDSTYAVRWAGDGYTVYRKANNVRALPQSFVTPEAAKAGLLGLYPTRRVA